MKVLTVIGARPQFIKAAAVSRVLRHEHQEILVHTGQHYNDEMSAIFFRELDIPEPDYNLEVGSGCHGQTTGLMMIRLEEIVLKEKPDWVIVYGDTNSTLAGGLVASKLHVPVAHVEAGLRSYNKRMPEEINRVLVDHISDLLLCPTQTAIENLIKEGITQGVLMVGDVMEEVQNFAAERAQEQSQILQDLNLSPRDYILMTVHRAENTDDPNRMGQILEALNRIQETIIFPVHPRTQKILKAINYAPPAHVHLIEPVGYLDMVQLQQNARMILTDSGGVQKEAYWVKVPCVTLRDETEWVETVHAGWNKVVGANADLIVQTVQYFQPPIEHPHLFGEGKSVLLIMEALSCDYAPV